VDVGGTGVDVTAWADPTAIWVVSKNMMEPITRTYRNIGGSFM